MPTVVAVDLDEVLGSFVQALCNYHNEKYATNLKLSDFHSYTFAEVWGGSDAESTAKVHDFFTTHHFKQMSVVRGAKEGIAALREMGFRLVVVTSRQLIIKQDTENWLRHNFAPDSFTDVVFGNHWGLHGRKISKLDLCKELGAKLLIDDSLIYAKEIAAAGMQSVLFDLDGSYMWNKTDEPLPRGIIRVSNWQQVIEQVARHTPESTTA